jgi:hypothetical protein
LQEFSEKGNAARNFPADAHLASDADGQAGVADWTLTRQELKKWHGETDERSPHVRSEYESKNIGFAPSWEFEPRTCRTTQRIGTTMLWDLI